MYNFILNMWIMHKVEEKHVQTYVTKGYITQQQADMIFATPTIRNSQ